MTKIEDPEIEKNPFDRLIEFFRDKSEIERLLQYAKVIAYHESPDSDVFGTIALLFMELCEKKKIKLEKAVSMFKFLPLRNGDCSISSIKECIFVDRGHKDFDHHGTTAGSSFEIALTKLGLARERWLTTIRKVIYNSERKGFSNAFDINEISKVIGRSRLNEREKIELGVKTAYMVLLFHKRGLERNADITKRYIQDFFAEKKEKMPKRFKLYEAQMDKETFQRPCDLCEILSASLEEYGEKKTKRFGETLMELLYEGFVKYKEARKNRREFNEIIVREGYPVVVIDAFSKNILLNEKSHVVAMKNGGVIVIQKNKKGNVQVFFRTDVINEEVSRSIVGEYRALELKAQDKNIPISKKSLYKTGAVPEIPEWYYFLGDKRGDGTRGMFIFNGSLTAPDVPPTRIDLQVIVEVACSELRGFLANNKKA